jgi:hypothetical protein
VGGIFCDLKKAFNSVNHKVLLSKLQFYGIRGKFHYLITSYLSDGYQRVLITSTDLSRNSSNRKAVRQGVPQGSILGPPLFLFYRNDLPSNFNNSVKSVLFADDISLVISSYNNKQYKNYVNNSFARLSDWLDSNLLSLNFNKTKHVQFGAKLSTCEICVNYHNKAILGGTNAKFLGVVIESTCTWKMQKKLNFYLNWTRLVI